MSQVFIQREKLLYLLLNADILVLIYNILIFTLKIVMRTKPLLLDAFMILRIYMFLLILDATLTVINIFGLEFALDFCLLLD